MKELTDKLSALGAPIAEENQVVTLLGTLPASFQMLITALEARDTVTLSHVQQSLIHEEKKMNREYCRERSGDSGTALYHRERGSNRQCRQWKPKCFTCGQTGHLRRDCPKKPQEHNPIPTGRHNAKPAKEMSQDQREYLQPWLIRQ